MFVDIILCWEDLAHRSKKCLQHKQYYCNIHIMSFPGQIDMLQVALPLLILAKFMYKIIHCLLLVL